MLDDHENGESKIGSRLRGVDLAEVASSLPCDRVVVEHSVLVQVIGVVLSGVLESDRHAVGVDSLSAGLVCSDALEVATIACTGPYGVVDTRPAPVTATTADARPQHEDPQLRMEY
jgi:hypothetical protein